MKHCVMTILLCCCSIISPLSRTHAQMTQLTLARAAPVAAPEVKMTASNTLLTQFDVRIPAVFAGAEVIAEREYTTLFIENFTVAYPKAVSGFEFGCRRLFSHYIPTIVGRVRILGWNYKSHPVLETIKLLLEGGMLYSELLCKQKIIQ